MKSSFLTWMLAALVATSGCAQAQNSKESPSNGKELPKVYMYKEISSDNLIKIYEALGREAKGRVAVKLSTGEPGGHNFLQPALIKNLVQKVNGTIVECNTAYGAAAPIPKATSRQPPTTDLPPLPRWTSWMRKVKRNFPSPEANT